MILHSQNALRTLFSAGFSSIRQINRQQERNFFGYLRIAFNRVDESRLKEVGPDRLCAEW